MKHKLKTLFYLLLITQFALANDGAFYVSGNHLIPMFETDISVKKEILNIKRIDGNKAEINVYYEFYNPAKDKTIDVGFEADCPQGDADKGTGSKSKHPNIYEFVVIMNNNILKYNVAIVNDSIYYKDGRFMEKSIAWKLNEDTSGESDYKYVYHFKAKFKQGLNIIKHSYILDMSNSVSELYRLTYILTAAKRWSNKQIDDFTLNIDMGNFQEFFIYDLYKTSCKDWLINSVGKHICDIIAEEENKQYTRAIFYIKKGSVILKKTNFKPAEELVIICENHYQNFIDEAMSTDNQLPFNIENQDILFNQNKLRASKQILRNLPYARRGYVFTNPELKAFYEKQRWYMPDINYVATLATLTKEEQAWLKKLDE